MTSPAMVQSGNPPFPWRQMIILGTARICEPIAFMSIFPYVYYQIKSFHMTEDDRRIALYAGLVTSVYALAECLAGPFWGRLSDKYGRKPILLTGLAGTGLSMLVFGFSQNIQTALIARAIGGILNGNIGVIQTTVAEIVNCEQNQARCFAMMPFVWCLGAIIGSALGGALADPVRNYPSLFQTGTIFERYPYLLTNLVCAGVVAFSFTFGLLFLEETHEDKRDRRDIGLEMGNRIIQRLLSFLPQRWIASRDENLAEVKVGQEEEALNLLYEETLPPPGYSSAVASPSLSSTHMVDEPPAYRSVDGSPRHSFEPLDRPEHPIDLEGLQVNNKKRDSGISGAFTKQVILNIAGFGILAYHTISAEQLLPVLFSLPATDIKPQLPFKFSGGFELPTRTIGIILACQGFVQMFATLVVFPMVNRRLGNLSTYRLVVLTYPLLYIVVPYISLVPTTWRMPAVCVIMVWKVIAQALAFPSSSIMLANAAPSKKVLGTLNGAASSAASGFRAFGPTISGMLQSSGLSIGMLGLPWWTTAVIACAGAIISCCMVEERRQVFAIPEKSIAPLRTSEEAPESPAIHAAVPDLTQVAAETLNASSDGLLSTPGSPLFTRSTFATPRSTS